MKNLIIGAVLLIACAGVPKPPREFITDSRFNRYVKNEFDMAMLTGEDF